MQNKIMAAYIGVITSVFFGIMFLFFFSADVGKLFGMANSTDGALGPAIGIFSGLGGIFWNLLVFFVGIFFGGILGALLGVLYLGIKNNSNDPLNAGSLKRLAAFSIDSFISGFLGYIFSEVWDLWFLYKEFFMVFVIYFYWVFLTYKFGNTIGKHLLGMKVISQNESDINLKQIFISELVGKFISSVFLIGYIQSFVSKDQLALHDIISKTKVVKI